MLDLASGDGVLAELLAPHAHRYVCVDTSPRVVAAAAERLRPFKNVEVRTGDMHALPFADGEFDLVVLMHALTYAAKPAQAVAEASRVLRSVRLCGSLASEQKASATVRPFIAIHRKELRKFADNAGLDVRARNHHPRKRPSAL